MNAKKLRRILSIALVIAMLAVCFTGCSKDPGVTTTDNPADSTTTSDEVEKHYLTAMVSNVVRGDGGDFNNREIYLVWQKFEEMCEERGLYITWQVIESDQYDTALNSELAAGDNLADFIWLGNMDSSAKVSCAENGLFVALEDILEYSDGTAAAYFDANPSIQGKISCNGKMYWIPEVQNYTLNGEIYNWGEPTGICVRQDWLEVLDMEVPTDFETLEAYMKACQDNDMNQNGLVDEYYCCALSGIDSGFAAWFGLPRKPFSVNVDTGEVGNFFEMKNTKDYFRYMKKLIDLNYISIDSVGATDDKPLRVNNKTAAYSAYFCNNWSLASCTVPEGAAKPVLIGCEPTMEDAYIGHDAAPLMDYRSAAFTKNLKDKEAAAILLDILCSDEFALLSMWGVEGQTFEVVDGEKVLIGDAKEENVNNSVLSGLTYGRNLWGYGALPLLNYPFAMETDYPCCETPEALEVNARHCAINGTFTNQPDSYMQTPTLEEAERLTELEADYNTLVKEICVDIYLGRIDIETEWDSKVIQPLKEAGMDELYAIYQARTDRFFGK